MGEASITIGRVSYSFDTTIDTTTNTTLLVLSPLLSRTTLTHAVMLALYY